MNDHKRQHASKFSNIQGLRIHYIETYHENHRDGTPILLMLAGWPTASTMYIPLAQYLAPQIKCYILDLPGFGGSESDMDVFCGFKYYLDFLRIFHIDVIRCPHIHVFGYSTGGIHAMNYAHAYPDAVHSLTLFSVPYDGIEQFATMEKNSASRVRAVRRLYPFFTRHKALIRLINMGPIKLLGIALIYLVIYTKLYPRMMRTIKKRHIVRNLYKTSKFNIKTIFDLAIDLSLNDFTHVARAVHTPTLVLSATLDTAVSPERSKKLAESMPHALYECVLGADHSVGISDPHLITDRLRTHIHHYTHHV